MKTPTFIKIILFLIALLMLGVFILNRHLFIENISISDKNNIELKYDAVCQLELKDCLLVVNKNTIRLKLSGKLKTMQLFSLMAELSGFKNIEKVVVNFKMSSMNMGFNQFILNKKRTNYIYTQQWVTSILLPVCTSKRSDWDMVLKIETKDTVYTKTIQLEIE